MVAISSYFHMDLGDDDNTWSFCKKDPFGSEFDTILKSPVNQVKLTILKNIDTPPEV